MRDADQLRPRAAVGEDAENAEAAGVAVVRILGLMLAEAEGRVEQAIAGGADNRAFLSQGNPLAWLSRVAGAQVEIELRQPPALPPILRNPHS